MLRVLTGIPILYVLIPGYAIALILSFFVPDVFTSIAFDSGGVASGPMTATFLLPFAVGACAAMGGNIAEESFRELLVRWFAWGCFCPVFRMHGERSPWYEREQEFINNVRQLTSGQDNEVWSFGEDNYEILKRFLFVRGRMRPYIRQQMKAASETGAPVMRPVFFDFPADKQAWEV